MIQSRFKHILILLGLSFLAALFGLGYSYHSVMTPQSSGGYFYRISADKWLQDGAEIRLPNLASRGNRLTLNFDPWRPSNAGPAEYSALLCGKEVTNFKVTDKSPKTIYLSDGCEPRVVKLQVKNPLAPSKRDDRRLGNKLESAAVSSAFGVPIVEVGLIGQVALLIAILSLLVLFLIHESGPGLLAAIVPIASGIVLGTATKLSLDEIFALWSVLTSLLFGMHLSRNFNAQKLKGDILSPAGASVLVAIIVLCGGILRFYGLSFGLPKNFHPDEVPKINAIMRMVDNGDLNPRYFLHPSLLLYSTYAMNSLFHLVGIAEGPFRDSGFLAGRTVSALGGTFSILLLYFIGKRLFSRDVGVVAALLLATFPLHVTCSRYLKEDALLLFCLLAATLATIAAAQDGKKRLLGLAAFLAGCAASVKYSGLLGIVIVGAAPWIRSRSLRPDVEYFKATVLASILFPIAFVLCTPYAVLDYNKFLSDFGSEKRHMLRGHTNPVDAWSQYWMYHVTRSIIPGVGLLPSIIGGIGLGILLWRRKIEDLFLIALVLLFYGPAEWVKAKPAPQPERYILPCLPFIAIAVGEALRVLRSKTSMAVCGILLIGSLFSPLQRTVLLASDIKDDTRLQMARWMIDNLPHGSKVYLDWKPYAPRFFKNEFEITHIPRATILQNLQIDHLRNSGQDYLVLSSLFYDRYFSDPTAPRFIQVLFEKLFEEVPIITEISAPTGTYGFHNPTLTLFSLKPEAFKALDEEREKKKTGEISETRNDKLHSFYWRKFLEE